MITNKDLNTLNLSPTNKDYYQVWSELIDTASKLSERWDPSSTNESDPGIVLLKVLTAIADKLNYNIDKNILEAFMPTAAQAESMKRLCDMLGYHIGYYESATTDVTIRYVGNTADMGETENPERLPDGTDPEKGIGLVIPAFTVLHNEDKTIYYSTTQEARLTNEETFLTIPCIEGQRILCESNGVSIIRRDNLSVNNRYYLPEIQIAENGIFVYGTVGGQKTTTWKKVNNLNIIPHGTHAYSFGYDSAENRPYLQFPDDVGFLMEDGLQIYYIRTSGAAGNISARTLSAIEKPTVGAWADYADSEKFVVTNPNASYNGKNPETIDQAYNGFKKTIGTFDTLVTCRDYMNKIYQLVDDQNNELVSNVIVSDIRDDINRAHTLCSFSDYGIVYLEKGNYKKPDTIINSTLENQGIDHFDLILYPFKAYQHLGTSYDFNSTFNYHDGTLPLIKAQLADIKSISHNIVTPVGKEITCIKNYLKLNARISTVNKVNSAEETLILDNVKKALYDAFNMRELDFGEEIPYESILQVMENADPKIKSIALDEPTLYTKFATAEGKEYDIASVGTDKTGLNLYNKLALRNILAGRVELFNYDLAFKVELGEAVYPTNEYKPIYPETDTVLTNIVTECNKDLNSQFTGNPLTLKANEVIKFRAPSLKTLTPYSAYVNYHLILNRKNAEPAQAARFLNIDQLWLKSLDATVSGVLPNWDEPSGDNFSYNGKTFTLFGINFFRFLEQKNFYDKLTDFVEIGTVNKAGMINASNITFPAGVTEPKTVAAAKTTLDNLNEIIKKGNTEDNTEYATAVSAKEALDPIYKDASSQLARYKEAAKKCCLYLVTNTGKKLVYSNDITEGTLCNNAGSNNAAEYYVVELKNTGAVMNALADWANSFGNTDIEIDEDTPESVETLIGLNYNLKGGEGDDKGESTAIYRNIGANYERNPGKYIDASRQKFMPATQADASQTSAWAAYYWPAPRCLANGIRVELTRDGWIAIDTNLSLYSKTSLGTDAKLAGIKPTEEYQLKEGEHLFINYTPASNAAASDQATSVAPDPINIHHGKGTIIRPNENLTLYDSATYHNSGYHSWAKTSGFDFSAFQDGQNVEGMYSLAATEQIDIRDFIEVTLTEPSYMYWMLNDTHVMSATLQDTEHTYTLQDGEYVFYTDKNKLDMAYYGAGTELRIEGKGERKIVFRKDITQVNLEEVLLNGVSAIPWKMVGLDTNNYIVLREFQYITLTDGDSIKGLVLKSETGKDYLDNTWTLVDQDSPCYYAFSDSTMKDGGTPLPKFNLAEISTGGTNKGSNIGWEVRSYLELNTGPDSAQLLNEGNTICLFDKDGSLLGTETITDALGNTVTKPKGITPQVDADGNIIPLAVKTNITLKSPGGDVHLYANTDTELNKDYAIKLKVFEEAPLATISSLVDTNTLTEETNAITGTTSTYINNFSGDSIAEALTLYNFNTLWTLVSAENFISNSGSSSDNDRDLYSWVRVHANVPSDHYNLMMLYYLAPETPYTFGQGMGFRFYTYRDKPAITMASQSNQLLKEFSYNGHKFDMSGKNLETATNEYYLLNTNAEKSGSKQGTVILDADKIIFKYFDSLTGESFEDEYEYELDHAQDKLVLYTKGSDHEVSPDLLTASVQLKTDSDKPECIQSVICRGMRFNLVGTSLVAGNKDIIGKFTIQENGEVKSVEIFADHINLYDTTKNILNTWYYTYLYNTETKKRIITLYKNEAKTKPVTSPIAEGCLDFTGDDFIMYYKGNKYTLEADSADIYKDNLLFGEYTANSFNQVYRYTADKKVIKVQFIDISSASVITDTCPYQMTQDAVTNNYIVKLDADRFLLDAEHSKVKIFNNISLEELDNCLSKSQTRALTFDDYFNKLHWWTQKDLGYENTTSAAVGPKELASYADLTRTDEEEDAGKNTLASYRKISSVYFLKPGLNIITFKESGKFEFFSEIDAAGALFLSDIDSIKKSTADLGLNLDMIDYQYSDGSSDLEARQINKIAYKLLRDIKEKDPNGEFYYNCPLQTATALDINSAFAKTEDAERLSDPKFWYEPNNINNKFVISQIDTDHLDKGVVIAKASKLR